MSSSTWYLLIFSSLSRSEIAWREAKYAQIYEYLREEYEVTQRFGNLDFKLKFVEVPMCFIYTRSNMVPVEFLSNFFQIKRWWHMSIQEKMDINRIVTSGTKCMTQRAVEFLKVWSWINRNLLGVWVLNYNLFNRLKCTKVQLHVHFHQNNKLSIHEAFSR